MEFEQSLSNRLWGKDGTLWSADPEQCRLIINRLGWLDSADWMRRHTDAINRWIAPLLSTPWLDHVLLLGMGGSSLAPEVYATLFPRKRDHPSLGVIDTSSPEQILQTDVDLSRTLCIVASKSGTTVETTDLCDYFYHKMKRTVSDPGRHFVAITDPGSVLHQLARERQFQKIFVNPSDIGGRYSALSYFGLVPAALVGVDLDLLSRRVVAFCQHLKQSGNDHEAVRLGQMMGQSALAGQPFLAIQITGVFFGMAAWIEQLVAESTGKGGKGVIPLFVEQDDAVSDEPSDAGSVKVRMHAGAVGGQTGHWDSQWTTGDVYQLGAEFFRWEFATAVAAAYMKINPFDEPDVAEAKHRTRTFIQTHRVLQSRPDYCGDAYDLILDKKSARGRQAGSQAALYDLFWGLSRSRSYIAILVYLPRFDVVIEQLDVMRQTVVEKTGRPVVVGFGPRYLHSTGQLHKGGPSGACFIQIIENRAIDLVIPDRPYTFGELHRAQADGDFSVLQAKDRPIMRILLKGDRLRSMERLLDQLSCADEVNRPEEATP